jgi:hypothetical protein
MADLSGFRNAAASIFGGAGIQQRARTLEEQRLIDARMARARMDAQITAAAQARQEYEARQAFAAAATDPAERNVVLGGLGSDYSAYRQGALREQELGFRQGVVENFVPNPAQAAAYGAGFAKGPVNRTAVSGGMMFDPTAVAGGGQAVVTPLGQADIATEMARAAAANALRDKRGRAGDGSGKGDSKGTAAADAKAREEARKIAALAFPDDPRKQIASNPEAFKVPGYPSQPEIFVAEAAEKVGGFFDPITDVLGRVADTSGRVPLPPAERVGQSGKLAPAITRDGGGAPVPPVPGVKKGAPAAVAIPEAAILKLRANPEMAPFFEQKYGVSAAEYL